MNGEVKHFHDSEIKCSAIVTDWAELNKLNDRAEEFFLYLGNYFDDDSNTVWAVFGDRPRRYCIKINE
jgi:hypothetical protein